METNPEQKAESSTPTSVRFTPETKARLKTMLDNSFLAFPDVLDFAVSNLLDELASGKEIRIVGKKLQLVPSHPNGASEASVAVAKVVHERENSDRSKSSGSKRKTR